MVLETVQSLKNRIIFKIYGQFQYFTNYFYFHDGIIEIYKSEFEKVSEWDTTIQDTMEEYDNVER